MAMNDYEYQPAHINILEERKRNGWEIVPDNWETPLSLYMNCQQPEHQVDWGEFVYMRRLIRWN